MFSAALSADAFFSFAISATVLFITIFSVVHELRETISATSFGRWLVVRSERARQRLLAAIERGYELRFVSLFVLFALFVSTLSPVSALIEIEERIVTRSCQSLVAAGKLSGEDAASQCASTSRSDGLSVVASQFGETQGHLMQIAVWPLVATAYGFVIALFFRVCKRQPNEPVAEVIERAPHVFHIVQFALAAMAFLAGLLQNAIGT